MSSDVVRALRLIGERKVVMAADGSVSVPSAAGPERLEADAVAELLREGLLACCRGEVSRTAEGRMHLRRALAEVPGDAFAAQHREAVARIVGDEVVEANAAESPLAWLATRKDKDGRPLISAQELEAGRRLSVDFARGRSQPRVTQSWDASGVRGGARRDGITVGEAAEDARRRTEAALSAVGPGLAEVLVAVCCEEVGLEAVEKRQRWPARSGKVVLRLALSRLAVHYGIDAAAVGSGVRLLAQWGTADYRPRFSA